MSNEIISPRLDTRYNTIQVPKIQKYQSISYRNTEIQMIKLQKIKLKKSRNTKLQTFRNKFY